MDFSPEQRRVIDARGNIIVSAGAGSGKTTVMIQNILNRIINGAGGAPVKLTQMLIVTFTKASAADMKVKLAEELAAAKLAARKARDTVAERRITEAEDDIPICDIGTLHSFCYRLISSNFFAAGIDPSSGIADEGEATLMLENAVHTAVSAALDGGDADFAVVNDVITKRPSSNSLEKKIKSVVEYALSVSDPEQYLGNEMRDADFFDAADGIISKRRAALVARVAELRELIHSAKFVKLIDAIEDLIPFVDGTIDSVRSTSVPQDTPNIYINDEYKQLKKDCVEFRKFVNTVETAKTRESSVYSRAVLAVARDALRRYIERKRARALLDYSDLEHGALRVLETDACRAELAERIRYVYIDEYQDVNPLQHRIERLLAGFATMFVVGDVKQSIYGFRRCDPKFFTEEMENPDFEHVPINGNYRSSGAVIDFVNAVFTNKMTRECGGADYKEQRLECRRPELDGDAKYVKINADNDVVADLTALKADDLSDVATKSADGAPAKKPIGYSVVQAGSATAFDPEAVYVANAVKAFIDDPANKHKTVAVLTRSVGTVFCADLSKLFTAYGVPYRIGRSSALSECSEVTALLDILRCADNRYDDLALYTALRSPMGGFSDKELLEIAEAGEKRAAELGTVKARGKQYAFWQKVQAYDGEAYAARLKAFTRLRADIVLEAKTKDAADTLGYITSSIDYFRYVYESCPHGAAENVEALIALAAARNCDVHSFLEYCDKTNVELGATSGDSAVTVTTIHSSKGLQYDFVIVAETSKRFNKQDVNSNAIVFDGGIAIKNPDFENGDLSESVPHIVTRAAGADKLVAEEMRLFYVALTRAKSDLLVTGKYKTPDTDKVESHSTKFDSFADFMRGMPCELVRAPKPLKPKKSTGDVPPLTDEMKKRLLENCAQPSFPHVEIKTCVTAIAESAEDDYTSTARVLTPDDTSAPPRGAVSAGGEAAMLRGTAYHRAMELVDFDDPDMDYVAAHCENFELVTPDEILVAAANMKLLTATAAHVLRERYFIVDLSYVAEDGTRVERPLLQGIIDLLIVDGDGNATIVDYKTTAPEGLRCEAYRTQLALYAEAVEKSTPYKVKKKYLYSFVLGKIIDTDCE